MGYCVRITSEAKAETRLRIMDVATALFARDGWDATTTRSIAAEAGIATGTLFNYFESKEAIVGALLSESLANAQRHLLKRQEEYDTMNEELFALIWAELKSLRRFRKFLPSAAETILSPMRRSSHDSLGESIRVNHLEIAERIIVSHGAEAPLPPVALHLYWTLYLGVFGHWLSDDSPKQEDTLALLDQSLKLFVSSLSREESNHERQSEGPHRGASARKRPSPK